jgi:hypothetical protein
MIPAHFDPCRGSENLSRTHKFIANKAAVELLTSDLDNKKRELAGQSDLNLMHVEFSGCIPRSRRTEN